MSPKIKFELKEQLEHWRGFYAKYKVDWISLPDEISVTAEQAAEMKKLMELGFDKMIIIPEGLVDEPTITTGADGKKTISNLKYEKLHKAMSAGYTATSTGGDYDDEGKFQGSKDNRTGFRIILTKDVQELDEDALLKKTIDKSIDQLDADEELNKFGNTSLAQALRHVQ